MKPNAFSARQLAIGLLGTVLCIAHTHAAPPTYRVEMLDTGQFAEPSEDFPAGGVLTAVAFVSPNGRYVATLVGDATDPSNFLLHRLARLDLEANTATLIPEHFQPWPVGINDDGNIAVVAFGEAPDAPGVELHFWSAATGSIPFGETSRGAELSSHGDGVGFPRIMNNFNQILVQTENNQSVVWEPIADRRLIIGTTLPDVILVVAHSLNNLGQVVGNVQFQVSELDELDVRPFVWDEASGLRIINDLELISPNISPFSNFGRWATANAINDAGVIAGETRDENFSLLGIHWQSEATMPTLLPCPENEPSQPAYRCAVWMLNDAGEFLGGEEVAEEIENHFVWDSAEPYFLRDLIVDESNSCRIYAIANDGSLAGTCGSSAQGGGPALVIPVGLVPETTVVPAVVGRARTVAEGDIADAGLVTGSVTTAFDDDVPAGVVIDQSPEGGTEAPLGSAVDLIVSSGPAAALVCDVDGNRQVDRLDVAAIMGRRNQPAQGPSDPADASGDGWIDANDARQCAVRCTNPQCAP